MLLFRKFKILLLSLALIYAYIFGCFLYQNILLLLLLSLPTKLTYFVPLYLCTLVRTTLSIQEATNTDSFITSLINLIISKEYEQAFQNTYVKDRRYKFLKKICLNQSEHFLDYSLLADFIEPIIFNIFLKNTHEKGNNL